jgi:hypothetical protein
VNSLARRNAKGETMKKYDIEYEQNGLNKQETDLTRDEVITREKELHKEGVLSIKVTLR